MSYQQTREYLHKLESELKSLALWAKQPPSAQALASTQPFACDVMPFEHWLQFIFIPKMHGLIEAGHPLPSSIAIAPMAHHVWQSMPERKPVILLLNELDTLLNDAG